MPGAYVGLVPHRILDTRYGNGARAAPVAAHGTVSLQVTGRGGVPGSNVAAVVLNVTVTRPSVAGYVTVYPAGQAMPLASNLNFVAHQTVPNLVVVPVGSGGRINLTNGSGGTIELIADVAGYYTDPQITTTSLPPGPLAQPYSTTLTANYSTGAVWSVTSGALPPGLTLNGATIEGNPEAIGTSTFVATISNGAGESDSKALAITITPTGWSESFPQFPASNTSTTTPDTQLVGISCPSIGSCHAYGNTYADNTLLPPVVASLANGTWSASDVPAGGPVGDYVNDIACSTPTDCAAPGGSFLDTLANGTWSYAGILNMSGVSCPSQGVCIAVGSNNYWNAAPAAERLSGGTWTPMTVPVPTDFSTSSAYANLVDVSCASANACEAVGFYRSTDGNVHGLAETLTASGWTAQRLPQPSSVSGQVEFQHVSCNATMTCAAIGDYGVQSSTGQQLYVRFVLDSYTNGSWTTQAGPLPPDDNGMSALLNGVACGPDTCAAVGFYNAIFQPGYRERGLLETYSNGSWTAQAAPLPSDALGLYISTISRGLMAVRCPAVGTCVAIGTYATTHDGTPVAITLRNGSWTPLELPSPTTTSFVTFYGLDCATTAFCVAVGSYKDGTNPARPFAETYQSP